MRDRLAREPDLVDSVDLALITFTTPNELDLYQQRRSFSFPILLDPSRDVYRTYGMSRGRLLDVWCPATFRRYWEILRPSGSGSFRDLTSGTEDTRQLGGDIVIAPDGTLSWGHWMTGPADRPSIDDLVDAIRRAAR